MKLVYRIYNGYARFILRLTESQMYRVSWFVFLLIYYVVRYRRKIVTQNLSHSFPEKNLAAISTIRKKFYKNFAAIFHEMIYFSKYDREALLDRVVYTNPEVVHAFTAHGRSVVVAAGHCGNWELLGLTLPLATGCSTFGAAKPQSDQFFNDAVNKLRTRMGLQIVPSQHIYRTLLRHRDEPFAAFLVADQRPPKHEAEFWTTFMHQDTPVFLGPEHIAKALNIPVFFAEMRRTGQGRYTVTFTLISNKPAETAPYEISERYIRLLEKLLMEDPANWLWSHRRWKHQKEIAEHAE